MRKSSTIDKKTTREIMKNILLFGAQGMLGSELFEQLTANENFNVTPLARFNYDLHFPEDIELAFEEQNPDIVINCAAYSNVDLAENPENEKEVFSLNTRAPAVMAAECGKKKIPLFHFSTDYVFNGEKAPYDESSNPDPINVYGESKLDGEMAIWEFCETAIIIRTSRLYGKGRDNFIHSTIRKAKKNQPIVAINNEIGCFTYCNDLAEEVVLMIEDEEFTPGVIHLVGEDAATPLQVAEAIVAKTGSASEIKPITGESLKRAAVRPKNSTLITNRAESLRGYNAVLDELLS
jgi:dTDP-4-dehydrorhamnose reductase